MTSSNGFFYSRKYYDDIYEYRPVNIPDEVLRKYRIDKLLSEDEWRSLGI